MLGLGRRCSIGIAGAGIACVLALAGAGSALASPPICFGTAHAPGVLAGTYNSSVIVEGKCVVDAGPAVVRGNLTIRPHGALYADFALNARNPRGRVGSHLQVTGKISVGAAARLVLGCDPASYPCADDPSLKQPEEPPFLYSRSQVGHGISAGGALSVIVHNDAIAGGVTQLGGGGGDTCQPEGFEVFSAYEDSTITGNVSVSGLSSCWLGLARLHVKGNLAVSNDQLADPDAIEILANSISGNLACSGNSNVWDTVEEHFGNLFPRLPQPNRVGGLRSGQCIQQSPVTEGGPPGEGPF